MGVKVLVHDWNIFLYVRVMTIDYKDNGDQSPENFCSLMFFSVKSKRDFVNYLHPLDLNKLDFNIII